VSHRTVSERAAVSLGAITYHFGSKAAMLEAVHRAHLGAVHARARAAAGRSGRTARALLDYVERDLHEGRAGTLAAIELALGRARDPALRGQLRTPGNRSREFACAMLRAIGSANPELDSELLTAALVGLKLEWLAEGERSAFAKRLPEMLERLAELLLPNAHSRVR